MGVIGRNISARIRDELGEQMLQKPGIDMLILTCVEYLNLNFHSSLYSSFLFTEIEAALLKAVGLDWTFISQTTSTTTLQTLRTWKAFKKSVGAEMEMCFRISQV